MTAHHEAQAFDPTYVRAVHERGTGAVDPSVEATLVDPRSDLPPALRALIEAELKVADESTCFGELVDDLNGFDQPRPGQDVLLTAHLPSDLDLGELLDEDAASEFVAARPTKTPWDDEPGAVDPVPLPVDAILEPSTVHSYVELVRPAIPPAAETRPGRYRADTPIYAGESSDDSLVRPVDMSPPPEEAFYAGYDAPDPYDLSAIAGTFQPSAYGADSEETKTFFRMREVDDTSVAESYDDDSSARFSTPTPRGRATARGVSPQRYIPTMVGQRPLPAIGAKTTEAAAVNIPKPSPFLVAMLGIACIALMMVQVL